MTAYEMRISDWSSDVCSSDLEHSILASNTSGLSIAAMAAATTRPEKVIGWHWSSPAQVMAMAEIVVAPGTSEETRDAVVELARLCGKNPVVVREDRKSTRLNSSH